MRRLAVVETLGRPHTCRPTSRTARSSATPATGAATPASCGRTARSDDQTYPTFALTCVSGGACAPEASPAEVRRTH